MSDMTFEKLIELAKTLESREAEHKQLMLTLLTLQQAVAEMLDHMTKQAPMIVEAVKAGVASAKPPQVHFTAPPMPTPPEPQARGWRFNVSTHADGRIKELVAIPQAMPAR